jgi:hypothetical protein
VLLLPGPILWLFRVWEEWIRTSFSFSGLKLSLLQWLEQWTAFLQCPGACGFLLSQFPYPDPLGGRVGSGKYRLWNKLACLLALDQEVFLLLQL